MFAAASSRQAIPFSFGLVLLLRMTILGSATKADKAPINSKEFKALCWFYKAAEKAEEQEKKMNDFFNDKPHWEAIKENIRKADKLTESIKEAPPGETVRLTFSDSENIELSPETRRRVEVLLEGFGRKIGKMKGDLEKLQNASKKKLTDAIAGVSKTRFGETGEVLQSSEAAGKYGSSASRADGCKTASTPKCATKNGVTAGCSIMHDMFCLCLPGQGSTNTNYDNACGVEITGISLWHASTLTTDTNLYQAWTALKQHCEKMPISVEFTEENIRRAKTYLESLLGTGLQADNGFNAPQNLANVLGWTMGTSSDVCNGVESSKHGLCVDYGPGGQKLGKIVWLEAFDEAAEKLREVRKAEEEAKLLAATVQSVLASLEGMLIQANVSDIPGGIPVVISQSQTNVKTDIRTSPEAKVVNTEGIIAGTWGRHLTWFALAALFV